MRRPIICTICRSPCKKILLAITKPDRFERYVGIGEAGYVRQWVECKGCGAATDVHLPENKKRLQRVASKYYEIDFKNSSLAQKFEKVMSLPEAQSDNAERVKRVHAFMKAWREEYFLESRRAWKVLDIGAGLGVFLARFLERAKTFGGSWEATVVESDPLACEHLRKLGGLRVVEEMYPGKTPLKNFNLCTLNKVVEHVSAPVSFLEKTRRALSSNSGILYIELPDKMTISWRPPEDNILGALHCHLYDPKSIVTLLERSRYVPIQVMRFFEPSGKITVAAFATVPSVVARLAKLRFSS